MIKKLLLTLALASLLPTAIATQVYAQDPPAADSGDAPAPDDPDAQPYPPDGVIDPNAIYPTDGSAGVDQGEAGAEPPAEGAPPVAAPGDAPPAQGGQPSN